MRELNTNEIELVSGGSEACKVAAGLGIAAGLAATTSRVAGFVPLPQAKAVQIGSAILAFGLTSLAAGAAHACASS